MTAGPIYGLMAEFDNPTDLVHAAKAAYDAGIPFITAAGSVTSPYAGRVVDSYAPGCWVDPGPYGNMTNFLSPVDPIFFLHHSNMDRLWDVWTRKQKALGLPYLPAGADLQTYSAEPFLFYVDGQGHYVGPNSKAGDYLSTDVFDYDYEPGSGEEVVQPPSASSASPTQADR